MSNAGSAISGGPVTAGDILYAADGDLLAFTAADGEELWTVDGASAATDPVVVNGTIYVGGSDGVSALSER